MNSNNRIGVLGVQGLDLVKNEICWLQCSEKCVQIGPKSLFRGRQCKNCYLSAKLVYQNNKNEKKRSLELQMKSQPII